jgi:hypothetical protein
MFTGIQKIDSFIVRYHNSCSDNNLFDDCIDDWHESNSNERLIKFLGLTEEDYRHFCFKNKTKVNNFCCINDVVITHF